MKRNKLLYIFLAVLSLATLSCSKHAIETYNSGPFINMRTSSDTISLSFDLMPKDDSTLSFPINAMGYPAPSDRTVKVDYTAGTTATAGVHFDVLPCTIEAGSVLDTLKCVVHKTTDVTESSYKYISLQLVQNESFAPGVTTKVVIVLTAGLPNEWSKDWITNYYCELAYGAYSKAKFRFIMNALGTSEVVKTAQDYNAWSALKLFLNAKLDEYKKANGPLIDENNNEVTFPL